MQVVSVDELVSQKILPFNLYNENGDKIFSAGEVLTPGKLLKLRYISVVYKDDFDDSYENISTTKSRTKFIDPNSHQHNETLIESTKKFTEDELETMINSYLEENPVTEINKFSSMTPKVQATLKNLHTSAIDSYINNPQGSHVKLFSDSRDRIVEEVLPLIEAVSYKSELKIVGDYDMYHSVNVAILSTFLAAKMKLKDDAINDIALAALLHDIGKSKIPKKILTKPLLNATEAKIIQVHPQVGYKILKREFGLPEKICKVALEHHENNDGSGYPYGLSGELISLYSQVINVCNIYDNLASGKGHVSVRTPKEATKVMLEAGTNWFTPNIFYTFVYMTNYNDNRTFDELLD